MTLLNTFYPSATRILFNGADGGAYTAGPFRGILHTTETERFNPSTNQYYGHKNPPHFTLHDGTIYQHFPIDRAARALANPAGGVQTNRRSAIQIEIAWGAARIADMPEKNWVALREWMRWVESACDIQPICPLFGDSREYGFKNSLELSPEEWKAFNGWCGHQHVPENAHWDPGAIPMERLKGLGLRVTGQANVVEQVSETAQHQDGLLDLLASIFGGLFK